jgi:hypothetical protein
VKALILNGGGAGSPYGEISARLEAWARDRGAEPTAFDLTAMDIRPCAGCFGCWVRTPGRCVTRDSMDGIIARLAVADLWIFLTPIAYGGYGYHLKKALDRSIPVLLPVFKVIAGEVHHPLRYRYGTRRLAALGILPSPDPESERIFRLIVERNSINMHARTAAVVLAAADAAGPWERELGPLFAETGSRT